MNNPRRNLNAAALLKLLGRQPPPPESAQPLRTAAAGAGSGGGRPIDWKSPDTTLTLFADATDAGTKVVLQDDCGAQVLIFVGPDGTAKVRVIGCDGDGYSLTPDGLSQVHVDDPGGAEEEETPTGPGPMSLITVEGCVDGVNRTITVFGYVNP